MCFVALVNSDEKYKINIFINMKNNKNTLLDLDYFSISFQFIC